MEKQVYRKNNDKQMALHVGAKGRQKLLNNSVIL